MKLSRLIGLIHERYGNVKSFCAEVGVDYSYTTRVLNGKVDARRKTLLRIAAALSIAPNDIGFYFFPESCGGSEVSSDRPALETIRR